MTRLLRALVGFFLTWWGLYFLAGLDASVFFFLPFGNDAAVIFLVARDPQRFWLYPLMATAGSATGAVLTYWMGRKAGETGLPRLVPERRLDRLKKRITKTGALAMAIPAAMPPPFPLTPFLLTCGALEIDFRRLTIAFVGARIVRFGIEAVLARRYGEGILAVFRSRPFEYVIAGLIVVGVVGTILSLVMLWRRTRRPRRSLARG